MIKIVYLCLALQQEQINLMKKRTTWMKSYSESVEQLIYFIDNSNIYSKMLNFSVLHLNDSDTLG